MEEPRVPLSMRILSSEWFAVLMGAELGYTAAAVQTSDRPTGWPIAIGLVFQVVVLVDVSVRRIVGRRPNITWRDVLLVVATAAAVVSAISDVRS